MTNDARELPVPTPQRDGLKALRDALLGLHKTLMDSERAAYESVFGPIASSSHFLQLLLQDPWFAWMRTISELVAKIDEGLDGKEPLTAQGAQAFTQQTRLLLKASEEGEGFAKHYHEALQRDPDVVLEHGAVMKVLKAC